MRDVNLKGIHESKDPRIQKIFCNSLMVLNFSYLISVYLSFLLVQNRGIKGEICMLTVYK